MSVLKIKNANNEWESVPVINGEDGVSPTITTSKVGRETTLTITDVNGTHTATILDGADGSGSGDMSTSVYDTNNNGTVDNAEKVNNHTVQSDVPANAVFTDTTYTAGTGIAINDGVISNTQTSAAWGNITGTLSSQTDLQTALNNKADANDIPTKVSDLTNDSGFITSSSLPTKTSDLTNDSGFITSSSLPTKVSDLTNDSGFITSTVNNLTNYYTKTDTYTKTEVNNLIGSISSLDIEVVQTLPSSDISTSTIYLLPKSSSEQQNIYDEYIYVNSSWELIGSTAIDLSNYYTSTQVDNLLSNKASKSLYSDTTINVGRKSNTTVGYSSTAEGIDTTASGGASHAEGWETTASGQSSHAEGESTEASGLWSHAEGEFTVANSAAQHVFGRYNIPDSNDDTTEYGDYVEIVGNGSYNTPSNARTLDWSGNEALAGDLTSSGTVKATKGIWSRPTGEVGTATSDSNGCLLIKQANNTEAPNNGVVLEFGNSANWRGQLYIGDNSSQGIYYNGWSNGVRGTWQKLVTLADVVTSGSNSNGNYIKYGDGTMICHGKKDSSGNGFITITYPVAFTEAPTVTVSQMSNTETNAIVVTKTVNITASNFRVASVYSGGYTLQHINWIAIGKWK